MKFCEYEYQYMSTVISLILDASIGIDASLSIIIVSRFKFRVKNINKDSPNMPVRPSHN